MFHNLKQVLMNRLRQQGIGEAVEAARVTEIFRKIVAEEIGEHAARELRKVSLREDTLEVLAGSGALASELRMREGVIREKLRDRTGGNSYLMRIFG